MKKSLHLFIVAVFAGQFAFAQDIELSPTVISSAGNYSEAGNISLSWTLGEIAITTLQQGDLILTQGFQQAFTNDVGMNLNPIEWQIIAYPNPVNNELKIQFDLPDPSDFLIEIQDVSGRLLSQQLYKKVFPGDVIPVEMSSYKPGVYFFRISTTDREQVRVISIRKM